MAKYNLIKNGIFNSTTISGTGNLELTSLSLVSLIDDDIDTTAVTLEALDVLYLDIDLGHRLKIDSIQLYASDLDKQANITFQYKDDELDSFVLCAESVSDSNYIATVPDPSAPRYIRCTVSGLNIDLYELKVLSNDYIVEFGEDGSENEVWLDDTPIGDIGTPRAIEIFNNTDTSDKSATAYVCVDYTGNGKDNYIKISNTETGTYVGIDDEAIVGYEWKDWDTGSFDNTYRETDNTIRMTSTASSGTYTTSVVTLDDVFKASYFIVDADTEVAKSSISKDEDLYNGTIEIRSSDIPPTPINEIYWPYYLYEAGDNPYKTVIGKYIIGTDIFTINWKTIYENNSSSKYDAIPAAVDRRTGNIFSGYQISSSSSIYLRIYNRSGTELSNTNFTDTTNMYSNKQSYFDASHWIWFYVDQVSTLYHRDQSLASLGTKSIPSLFQLAAQLNGAGCWYTERVGMTLVKLLYDCSVDVTINLENIYGVCSTEDNGCWVVDLDDITYGDTIKRYDVDGGLIQTIQLDKAMYNLSHDNNDGFWARSTTTDGEVRHYNSYGVMDMKIEGLVGVDYLSGCKYGCVAYSSSLKKAYYIDKATASIFWQKDYNLEIQDSGFVAPPALFSYDLELQDKYVDDSGKLLPVSYDTLWYGDDNLDWQEVPKDGYFLPKNKYHQVRTTLRSLDTSTTPIMRSISMVPALKVSSIVPQNSKPIYVRTDIPIDVTMSQFDTRIKVWWDVEE